AGVTWCRLPVVGIRVGPESACGCEQTQNAVAGALAVEPPQTLLRIEVLAVVIGVVVGDVELGRVAPGDFERAAIDEARDRDRFPVPLQTTPPGHGHSPGAKATFIPIDSNSTASCAGSASGSASSETSPVVSSSTSKRTPTFRRRCARPSI